jgi:hypothetical protein
MSPIAATLQSFFTDRLAKQRQASPHAAYRDMLRLLLQLLQQRTGRPASRLHWTDLDGQAVSAFLDHDRHNSARTPQCATDRDRSLFAYATLRHPNTLP